jgi:hypothetical protein
MNKTATQVLEEQYADQAAQILREEIDNEILFDMLTHVGWTRVELRRLPRNDDGNINTWMHTECKKHWHRRGKVWMFESREEAALFKLTWSN